MNFEIINIDFLYSKIINVDSLFYVREYILCKIYVIDSLFIIYKVTPSKVALSSGASVYSTP